MRHRYHIYVVGIVHAGLQNKPNIFHVSIKSEGFDDAYFVMTDETKIIGVSGIIQ